MPAAIDAAGDLLGDLVVALDDRVGALLGLWDRVTGAAASRPTMPALERAFLVGRELFGLARA